MLDAVKQLANIPTKEVLLSQLLGLMQSPVSRTAAVLAALAEKKGADRKPLKPWLVICLRPQRLRKLKNGIR